MSASHQPDLREPDAAARLRAARADLCVEGPAAGRRWCEAWTAAVDGVLTDLAGQLRGPHRVAVAATGGYSRAELCPGSDLDLLLVYRGLEEAALERLVRTVVYPLWDAGLTVGYAVRTPEETAALAAEDLDTATATLDARLVAGDGLLVREVVEGTVERLRADPGEFLGRLEEADTARRARAGDAAEVLAPDLKRGAGGLRDVQSLRWAAAALVGTCGLDPLVSARYLGAPDRIRLVRAYDRVLAARVALHLETDRAVDVLDLQHQQAVAERLGYRDGEEDRDTAAHRLLSDLFLAARTIDHVHDRAWRLIAADARRGQRRLHRSPEMVVNGMELVDGVARLAHGQPLGERHLPCRLMEVLSRQEAVLDRRTAGRIRRYVEEGGGWEWDDATRLAFLGMLWRGDEALRAVAELDDVGVISAMLPEWDPVRGRPQRNPFHRYAVDRHGWHAAAELAELVLRERWAATSLEAVADRDALMLGTWLHDVGKGYGEPHSETGVPVARSLAERLGARPGTTDLVGRLVRLHLLLPDVAGRRDLADEGEIRPVAERIGDHETLAALHLLAAADGRATGPTAWTAWKASLVQTLVDRIRAVLDEAHPDNTASAAAATAAAAQRLAGDGSTGEGEVTGEAIRAHLAGLPQRYAASVSPSSVVRHVRLADRLGGRGVRLSPADDGHGGEEVRSLDLVARDRPGLLAAVAGVLALHDVDVVAANVFTRADGVAVDVLSVRPPSGADGALWSGVEDEVVAAVTGDLDVSARLRRTIEIDQRGRAPAAAVDTRVRIGPDRRGAASVLEVTTADRRGVLSDILGAVASRGLDVRLAKVQTLGHEVHDSFYVRDRERGPLTAAEGDELAAAVRRALRRDG